MGATTISSILVGIESTRVVKAFLNTPTADAAVASGLGLAELLDLVNWVPTVLVSPVIEETVKALGLVAALWLLRGRSRGMRDGLILGALVGLGFGIVETASYMVIAWDTPGQPSIESELLNRFALFGLTGHALWTGLAGAGLGLARTLHGIEAKTAAVLAGLLAAVCGHALHNALGTAVWVTFARRRRRGPRRIDLATGGVGAYDRHMACDRGTVHDPHGYVPDFFWHVGTKNHWHRPVCRVGRYRHGARARGRPARRPLEESSASPECPRQRRDGWSMRKTGWRCAAGRQSELVSILSPSPAWRQSAKRSSAFEWKLRPGRRLLHRRPDARSGRGRRPRRRG